MDQRIVLFPHKDITAWFSFLSPLSILEGIITYTSIRNKIIHQNRATACQFILSVNAEKRKRINRIGSLVEPALHSSVRYINTNDCKGNCKNSYQGVVSPMNGGNRP